MQLSDSLAEQLAAKLGNEAPADYTNTEPASTTFGQIARIVEKLSGHQPDRKDTFEDAGLGSLERIELAIKTEQECGARLETEKLEQLTTIGELCDYVEEELSKRQDGKND